MSVLQYNTPVISVSIVIYQFYFVGSFPLTVLPGWWDVGGPRSSCKRNHWVFLRDDKIIKQYGTPTFIAKYLSRELRYTRSIEPYYYCTCLNVKQSF